MKIIRGIVGRRSRQRIIVMGVAGVVVGLVVSALVGGEYGPVAGWAAACLVYLVWTVPVAIRADGDATRDHATEEDPDRPVADMLVLLAGVVSLGAVGLLLFGGQSGSADERAATAGLAVVSIGLSWLLVHTLYTMRYAYQYYQDPVGGIDFNQDEPPRYRDFAYLAFTVGMTFQVSDTDISDGEIRYRLLLHMLLSYVLGAVVIAATVNLVAGLAR
jgi:uncharacterized membrane protein